MVVTKPGIINAISIGIIPFLSKVSNELKELTSQVDIRDSKKTH